MFRPLLTLVFGSTYTGWLRKHRNGRVLLTTRARETGIRIGPVHVPVEGIVMRSLGVFGILCAAGASFVAPPELAGSLALVGVGVLVLSFWPNNWGMELREFALCADSDLSHVDERGSPYLVDYEWIDDIRWDDEGRIVLALSEEGTLNTSVKFVRTRIPEANRREVTRILWQRIGKSREELMALSSES